MSYAIHVGDVAEWARSYDGPPYHAMICDPPYELALRNLRWDATGVAFDPATWAALGKHLLPGAFGMAFASSRGWHRLAVAIEDAGLVIHPSIFLWVFGSGFPKATRLDTQIDAAAGKLDERPEIPRSYGKRRTNASGGKNKGGIVYGYYAEKGETITVPITPLAQAWYGHRYGLQAMKPATEPIIVFQKPYTGRPVKDITRTGAGALNVEAGRIDTDDKREYLQPTGRWPANFVLSHMPECMYVGTKSVHGDRRGITERHTSAYDDADSFEIVPDWHCAPGCPVATLGEQAGVEATRFFFIADYMHERLESTAPVYYEAKAARWERDAGLCGKWGTVSARDETARLSLHPTIKPLSLVSWLASLLLPPDLYAPRRLLVPFAGAGSEMISAMLAGWEYTQGVEMKTDYAALAWQRLEFWQAFALGKSIEEALALGKRADKRQRAQKAAGQLALPLA